MRTAPLSCRLVVKRKRTRPAIAAPATSWMWGHAQSSRCSQNTTRLVSSAGAVSEYMALVRQLRSHCRFVRSSALMSFATLIVASVASGVSIWHNFRNGKYGLLHTLVQCSNFVVWSGLLLLLLNGFVSVNEKIDATFIEKVRKGLREPDTSPEDRRGLLWLFQLIRSLEPAGWFLFGSQPITRSIFNLSAIPVVVNLVAKACDVIHNSGWVPSVHMF